MHHENCLLQLFKVLAFLQIAWVGIPTAPAWLPTDMLIQVLLPFFRHFYSTLNWTILKITEERRDILDKLSRPTHCTKNSIEHHQTFNALSIPISDKLRLDYATCSQISWIMRECNKGLLLRYKRIHGISLINVQRFIIFAFLIVIQGILNLAMFLIVLYFLYTWRKLLRFKFVTDIVSDAQQHIYTNPLLTCDQKKGLCSWQTNSDKYLFNIS